MKPVEEPIKLLERFGNFREAFVAVDDRAAIVSSDQQESDSVGPVLGDDVGEATGTFGATQFSAAAALASVAVRFAADFSRIGLSQESVMKPVFHHRLPMSA